MIYLMKIFNFFCDFVVKSNSDPSLFLFSPRREGSVLQQAKI
jgi:hypothetical protein